ncbi:MAG: tetratricopeptide repeat protein [Pseudomonadota bacterium]
MGDPYRYKAFISYSWGDRRASERLHYGLETFRTPKDLAGQLTPRGPAPSRLAPIFKDREEEPAGGSLRALIETALDESEFLIVICSPNSARSRWVNKEIAYFRKRRDPNNILPYIIAGEPQASLIAGREAEECFPPALMFETSIDGEPNETAIEAPLAADARPAGDGPRAAMLKIAAAMLGVGLDALVRRDAQRRVRRMRIALGAVSSVAVSMVALAGFAWVQRNEAQLQRGIADSERAIAESERANAEKQRDTANAALDYLVSIYKLANPATENPKTITALTILERGAKQIETDLRSQPETQAKLYEALGGVYQNLGDIDEAERLLTRAAAIPSASAADRLSSEAQLASIDLKRRRLDAAGARLDRIEKEITDAAAAGAINGDKARDFRMRIAENRALFAYLSGKPDDAARLYSEALQLVDPVRPDSVIAAARIATNRGLMLVAQNDFAAGIADLNRAESAFRTIYGDGHLLTAKATQNIAYADFQAKKFDPSIATMKKALDVYETVLEPEHPDLANARKFYGTILIEAQRLDLAVPALEAAAAGFEAAYGPAYYDLGYTLVYLAVAYADTGRADAAAAAIDRAAAIYAKNFEPGGFDFGDLDVYRGIVLAKAGKREEATRHCAEGLRILKANLGPDDPYLGEMSRKCSAA